MDPDDPRSLLHGRRPAGRARRPNAILGNQYHNPANPAVHYATTGPEIWEQTGGKIDVFVAGMGTGGTITGASRYLKEKNPNVKIVGVDLVGSLLLDTWKNGKVPDEPIRRPTSSRASARTSSPSTLDLGVCDLVVQVNDRESFLMARRLVREEGIFVGGSCGAAVAGMLKAIPQLGLTADHTVVVLLPDNGSRYLSKFFDDNWMRENGFLNTDWNQGTVADFVQAHKLRPVVTVCEEESIAVAIRRMKQHDYSQLPVVCNDEKLLGIITETDVLDYMLNNSHASFDDVPVAALKRAAAIVDDAMPLNTLSDVLQKRKAAVLVDADQRVRGVITMIDVIDFLAA